MYDLSYGDNVLSILRHLINRRPQLVKSVLKETKIRAVIIAISVTIHGVDLASVV
jgi:hypothetical protein